MLDRGAIVELRQYTLHPGRRDELISLFESEFFESQQACGIRIDGIFRDPDRPDVFVWLRSFPNMEARRASLEAFYGGAVWRRFRNAANATMVDSDNVHLLAGLRPSPRADLRGPLFGAVYQAADWPSRCVFADLARQGMRLIGGWTTEPSPNTFPRLPVREGENVFFGLIDGGDRETLAATRPAQLFELVPTARSPMQFRFAASPGDFAFLEGRWTVDHRILRRRLAGCTEWDEIRGSALGHGLLDGAVSVDEIDIGQRGKGTCFRHLDRVRRRWSIRWINAKTGALFPPVHGGFAGGEGELFGHDREDGRDVYVRYHWTGCGTSSPCWEQAFSLDGGERWETNWTMQFRR